MFFWGWRSAITRVQLRRRNVCGRVGNITISKMWDSPTGITHFSRCWAISALGTTSPQWFGVPKDKLFVTIFKGEGGVPRDSEAYDLWVAQGVSKDRIFEFGAKDNFWQMGDTGPCGPCSEIHYDMGPAASDQGHTDCKFGCECGRYVEIWNLVFMQFNRVCDLCDIKGNCLETHLEPLPKPSVDTGAGLERLAAVLQGKISNFDTDLFQPLIETAGALTQEK